MILVDTNVLLDLVTADAKWVSWSVSQLEAAAFRSTLFINPVVYSELSVRYETIEALDELIDGLQLTVLEMPRPALFLAGKAYARYRRGGGDRANVLPDFFIGAQAAIAGCALVTRDVRRYRTYFPTVELIAPD